MVYLEKLGASGIYVDKWKPSIFMPKFASRITLEITDVRVERLMDISEDDAEKEGIDHLGRAGIDVDIDGDVWNGAYKHAFKILWNKINGKKYPFESNPFVWVISFKKI